MNKRGTRKVYFCILISFILITFLLTFSTAGCGRRALLREKLKSNAEVETSQSASAQSGNESENAKEDTGPGQEQTIIEEATSQESVSNESSAEESVSNQEEETTAGQETTEETLPEEESVDQEVEELVSTTISAVASESGYMFGEEANNSYRCFVGDSGSDNIECRGYISFDISELSGSTISEASIVATSEAKYGSPYEKYGPMIIKAIYWGANPINPSVRDLDGVELANFFQQKDFTIDNEILKADLQNAVNSGSERYQITLYFEMNGTDGDGIGDAII